MSELDKLMDDLSADAHAVKPLAPPTALFFRLFAVLAAYAFIILFVGGLRADFSEYIVQPVFALEAALLMAVTLSSLRAALLLAYPDRYQRPYAHLLPALSSLLLILLLIAQLIMGEFTAPPSHLHTLQCTLCIAATAAMPAALIFILLHKGATTQPVHAGLYAVMAATAISGLTIRFYEANDNLPHLLQWHYAPIVAFAVMGAWLGKLLLKW